MDFAAYLSALRGKRVAVLGAGVSNRPLIELLRAHGVAVTVRDKKEDLGEYGDTLRQNGCSLCLGSEYLQNLTEDVIFRTPGLRPDLPELCAAVERGSVLTSEMEAKTPSLMSCLMNSMSYQTNSTSLSYPMNSMSCLMSLSYLMKRNLCQRSPCQRMNFRYRMNLCQRMNFRYLRNLYQRNLCQRMNLSYLRFV